MRTISRIRWDHEHFAMEAIAIAPSEFREGCAVYSRNGVTVTVFEVDHGKYIKPAYGYRVDYAGRSVVISGDPLFRHLIRHFDGATLIVHEVCASDPRLCARILVVQHRFLRIIRRRRTQGAS